MYVLWNIEAYSRHIPFHMFGTSLLLGGDFVFTAVLMESH